MNDTLNRPEVVTAVDQLWACGSCVLPCLVELEVALAKVVAFWDQLPQSIRREIVALLDR